MNSLSTVKIGDFLKRIKDPIQIVPNKDYKLVTIKLWHKGITLREIKSGKSIGSKIMNEVRSGQFILSGIDARNGAFGVVPDELDGAVVTNDFWYFDLNEKLINRDFFLFLTSTHYFSEICRLSSDGTTNRVRLQSDRFYQYEVKLPSIDEQTILLDKFRSIQIHIRELTLEIAHQQSLLKKLRQTILQEAVQGKLVPQDPKDEPASELLKRIKAEKEKLIAEVKIRKEKPLSPIKEEEIPFELPKGWVWCRLGKIIEIKSNLVSPYNYPNHPHIAPDNIQKDTGRLLNYSTVKEDNIQSANHLFYSGQIIYSKVRPKLNKVVIVDFEGLCSADMYPLEPFINSEFVLYTMLSPYFLNEVDRYDNRIKMPKINQSQLSQIPFPIPPLKEQGRVVETIISLFFNCTLLEKQIEENAKHSELLLQAVLKEAFEGKN